MRYVITVNETDEDRRTKRELSELSPEADRNRHRELKQHLNRALSTRAAALATKLSVSPLGARVVIVGRGEITVESDRDLSDAQRREIETAHDCTVARATEPDAP